MRLIPDARLRIRPRVNLPGPMDDDLAAALEQKVRLPYTMDWTSDTRAVLIRVQLTRGILEVEAPRKRLYPSTIYLFLLWVVGTALLLFGIAALFLRNQVRAIRRLAEAAEAFGLGRECGPIKPEGATEVRQAATAFNRMQARVQRFLSQRTEMLAGVSHDLRTPLTRLRLALAILPKTPDLEPDVADMTTDINEMERMIAGYLAFARGEGAEQAQPVDLSSLLEDIASAARRTGADVELDTPQRPDRPAPTRRRPPRHYQPRRQRPPPCQPDPPFRPTAGPQHRRRRRRRRSRHFARAAGKRLQTLRERRRSRHRPRLDHRP